MAAQEGPERFRPNLPGSLGTAINAAIERRPDLLPATSTGFVAWACRRALLELEQLEAQQELAEAARDGTLPKVLASKYRLVDED